MHITLQTAHPIWLDLRKWRASSWDGDDALERRLERALCEAMLPPTGHPPRLIRRLRGLTEYLGVLFTTGEVSGRELVEFRFVDGAAYHYWLESSLASLIRERLSPEKG